jgi:hypothetical protein
MRVVIEVVGGEEAKHLSCCLANKGQETSKSQKKKKQDSSSSSSPVIQSSKNRTPACHLDLFIVTSDLVITRYLDGPYDKINSVAER